MELRAGFLSLHETNVIQSLSRLLVRKESRNPYNIIKYPTAVAGMRSSAYLVCLIHQSPSSGSLSLYFRLNNDSSRPIQPTFIYLCCSRKHFHRYILCIYETSNGSRDSAREIIHDRILKYGFSLNCFCIVCPT